MNVASKQARLTWNHCLVGGDLLEASCTAARGECDSHWKGGFHQQGRFDG